ncbi:hypothetical protein J437_LFUL019551 [Ladona fulva]|uniref:Mos1 transposase HTH domain-containing protein n=1 Tax=Ladona fulva TaxID=123851 RepID=A0A8K0PBC9_LADFU|nr:hypothetical protein J437_LFUL019551 [Ladona fulva]
MESSLEQRYAIKFCLKSNKSLVETHKLIVQAFQGQCSIIFTTFKHLRKARKRWSTGWTSTSRTNDNLAPVRDLLNSDRRLSVQMIAETINIPKTIVHELVTDKLDMRKVCQGGS